MTEKYSETYFSTSKKYVAREGYLRFFPSPLVDWYFRTQQAPLEELRRMYPYFVPNPEGQKILEVGFGEGKFLRHCGKKNVVGIDLWAEGVKRLKAEGYDVSYHDASKRFPFEDSSFDIVYSEQVIEHIADGVSFVNEINRVLRKGGKAMIRTVDVTRTGLAFFGDYTHIHPYTKGSLFTIMMDHGFEVKEIFYGSPTSFLMRRLGNIAVLLPKPLQDAYAHGLGKYFSYELNVIAVKK
ncbi:MAG: class I SAM-dependent methyltransferase [Candidatus Micrarchaeia archaeon]|jgi:SAM-dependent methyltransferase